MSPLGNHISNKVRVKYSSDFTQKHKLTLFFLSTWRNMKQKKKLLSTFCMQVLLMPNITAGDFTDLSKLPGWRCVKCLSCNENWHRHGSANSEYDSRAVGNHVVQRALPNKKWTSIQISSASSPSFHTETLSRLQGQLQGKLYFLKEVCACCLNRSLLDLCAGCL